MASDKILALQLCPFSPEMENRLSEHVRLIRWFEMEPGEQEAFLASQAAEVRIAVTGGHIGCPAELMSKLPGLGLVAINGVGFDKVPMELARQRGVAVTTTPGVLTDDVADLAIGLMIALKRGIAVADSYVRDGRWLAGDMPLARKVSGSRFGILGLGAIGSAIASRAASFGEVGYFSRTAKPNGYRHFPSIAALAEWSDVLFVACASTPETAGIVDAAVLSALGRNGYLVNISRGAVVDEAALIAALDADVIAGAALDVFVNEPHVPGALCNSARTVLTPHIASATQETRTAMADLVLANVQAFLAGKPPVSPVA